jgi:hypothetical protein
VRLSDFLEQLDNFSYDLVTNNEERIHKWLIAFGVGLLNNESNQLSAREERLLYEWGARFGERLRNLVATCRVRTTPRPLAIEDRKSLRQLQSMDPYEFEEWVGRYFEAQGYRDVLVTQGAADFGVDVFMCHPRGGDIVVQCKRFKAGHLVGRPIVQQTYGVMHLLGAKHCYVVTSSGFSEPALDLERDHKDIVLIDGERLCAT